MQHRILAVAPAVDVIVMARILRLDRDAVGVGNDIENAGMRADRGAQHCERERELAVVVEEARRRAAAGGDERHAGERRAKTDA